MVGTTSLKISASQIQQKKESSRDADAKTRFIPGAVLRSPAETLTLSGLNGNATTLKKVKKLRNRMAEASFQTAGQNLPHCVSHRLYQNISPRGGGICHDPSGKNEKHGLWVQYGKSELF